MTVLSPVILLALGSFLGFLGLAVGGQVSRPLVIVAAVLDGAALVLMLLGGHA